MYESLTRQSVPWEAVIALDGADRTRLPTPLAEDSRVCILALPRQVGAACARNLALGCVHTGSPDAVASYGAPSGALLPRLGDPPSCHQSWRTPERARLTV